MGLALFPFKNDKDNFFSYIIVYAIKTSSIGKRKTIKTMGYKMKKLCWFTIIAVLFFLGMSLSGCATVQPAPPVEQDNTTAKVYFIMTGNGAMITGGGIALNTQFWLWDSDTFISNIGGKEYLMVNMKAGTHYIMASGGNWWIVEADLAAGKSYFFEVITMPGFSRPSARLRLIEPGDPELDQYFKDTKEISLKGKATESMVKQAAEKLKNAQGGSQNIDKVYANQGI